MSLYKLFSYNVEVQYKSSFLSKATFFTLTTVILNIILPFIIANKSKGFWLRSQSFYEQPVIHFTFEYLLVAELDDPSQMIVCGEADGLQSNIIKNEEYCAEFQVQEYDINYDGKYDLLDFKFHLNLPEERFIDSLAIILSLDFQLQTACPLQMQSLAVINRDFGKPSSGFSYFGDLQLYQTTHLPCKQNIEDLRYNNTLFSKIQVNQDNIIDNVLGHYFMREVTTQTKAIYSRNQNGYTQAMDIQLRLRVPEMKIRYVPTILQELKWAWPQYLSLMVVFYWIFNKIKRFVFNNRLLMAWEVTPWKKHH